MRRIVATFPAAFVPTKDVEPNRDLIGSACVTGMMFSNDPGFAALPEWVQVEMGRIIWSIIDGDVPEDIDGKPHYVITSRDAWETGIRMQTILTRLLERLEEEESWDFTDPKWEGSTDPRYLDWLEA